MAKVTYSIVVMALAGCASTRGWRTLYIDGSSQSSLERSVFLIQQELPASRRERFDMVLADLWITGTLNSEAEGAEYTEVEYFAQLDGLRYEDVLELAGPETTPRYWAVVQAGRRRGDAWAGRPWSGTDPDRFPSYVQPPPGMMTMAGQ